MSEPFLARLFASIDENPKMEVKVDLPNQTITNLATGESERFEINAYKKECLMSGYDDIDYLLSKKNLIEDYESKRDMTWK